MIVFDEATKALTSTEKLSSGMTLNTKGDWASPISIRYTIDPVKIKGQALQLRRNVSIVAAHSFTFLCAGYSTHKRFVLGGEECAAPFSSKTVVAYCADGCSPVDKGQIGTSR